MCEQSAEKKVQKIVNIRTRLDSKSENDIPSPDTSSTGPVPPVWDDFTNVTPEDVKKIVMNTKATTCQLDPVPTSFLKVLIDVLLPIWTTIANMSFKEGHFPDELKLALILPLLKKIGLDPEIFKHFRPVSNLAYLSKLMERLAASQLLHHIDIKGLHELYQSSYKKFHSTETALLKIQSDILSALDNKKCVLLILLDLSAAFDTIDHSVLLSRLKADIGISGKVFQWFKSYLKGRKQALLIDGVRSALLDLLFGVPQGSVLGPLLFIIYMGPLGKILRNLGISFHFYADDSQVYVSFNVSDSEGAVNKVEEAVTIIKSWMNANFLCLNGDKTELLLIASKFNLGKLDIPHINICGDKISPATKARNIGFIFDSIMDCRAQITQTCKSGWFHLSKIGKIRQYLDEGATKILVHAFITSRIDMNNCLYLGLPDNQIRKLQLLQNAAARIIMRLPKHCHITETLHELHWLPVSSRIHFKIILMVYKALNNMAPQYLTDLLTWKPSTARNMRSNNQNLLMVPKSNTVTYGDRNFTNVAPSWWNALPHHLRDCDNIITFKRLLKTHLFKLAYNL